MSHGIAMAARSGLRHREIFYAGAWVGFDLVAQDESVTAAVVRDRGVVGAGQMDDRVEVRLPRS